MTEPEPTESETLERAESDAAAEAATIAPAAAEARAEPNAAEPDTHGRAPAGPEAPDGGLTTNDYTVAFSPRQVAVGLAIVAGLVALVARRRRRKGRPGRDED
jgi:hypothetical protein